MPCFFDSWSLSADLPSLKVREVTVPPRIVVQLSEAMGSAADAARAQGGQDDKSRPGTYFVQVSNDAPFFKESICA